VLYVPPGTFVGHDALDKFAGDLRATHPIMFIRLMARPRFCTIRHQWARGRRACSGRRNTRDVLGCTRNGTDGRRRDLVRNSSVGGANRANWWKNKTNGIRADRSSQIRAAIQNSRPKSVVDHSHHSYCANLSGLACKIRCGHVCHFFARTPIKSVCNLLNEARRQYHPWALGLDAPRRVLDAKMAVVALRCDGQGMKFALRNQLRGVRVPVAPVYGFTLPAVP
jgi:hypothetical protein